MKRFHLIIKHRNFDKAFHRPRSDHDIVVAVVGVFYCLVTDDLHDVTSFIFHFEIIFDEFERVKQRGNRRLSDVLILRR